MECKVSVTVMPILNGRIGFVRRTSEQTFPNMLVAPGGKMERTDGELLDGCMYNAAEATAKRELKEETGIDIKTDDLFYFCSLTFGDILVMSFSTDVESEGKDVIWLSPDDIGERSDFAPGMKQEALLLCERIGMI
jgi:ADP-ribose pyrophosphatase YjhB (NUDIX family)